MQAFVTSSWRRRIIYRRSFLLACAFALVMLYSAVACTEEEPTERPDSGQNVQVVRGLADPQPELTSEPTPVSTIPESLRGSRNQSTPAPEVANEETNATPEPTRRPLMALIPAAQTSPETDREALIALYKATGGENWRNKENWLSDEPLDAWAGVTTDDRGRVIVLNSSATSWPGRYRRSWATWPT